MLLPWLMVGVPPQMADLLFNQRIAPRPFCVAPGLRILRKLLEIIQVIKMEAGHRVQARVHVARNREVHEAEGPSCSVRKEGFDVGPVNHVMRGLGADDPDVHVAQARERLLPGEPAGLAERGKTLGFGWGAADDPEAADARLDEMARCRFGRLPRAPQ